MDKNEHKRRSVNYKAQLKKAIYDGNFESIIMSIMLLAVKHNDEEDWKASVAMTDAAISAYYGL